MATAKSDDESDVSSHPLAENRPGVYVQVVTPRRRKKNKRADSASSSRPPAGKVRGGVREETDARVRARRQSDPRVAESDETALPASSPPHLSAPAGAVHNDLPGSPSEAPTVVGRFDVPEMFAARASDSEPATEPGLTGPFDARASNVRVRDEAEEDDGRQSGERPVDFDSVRAREGASASASPRPDLSGMSLPPPPRLPSFARGEQSIERISETPAPLHSASLLDAPPTLRPSAPDSTPAARSSVTLLAFVGAFSAIIVMAGLVALRELTKPDPPAAQQTRPVIAAPVEPGPVAAPPASAVAPVQPAPATTAASTTPSAAPVPAVPAAAISAAEPRGQRTPSTKRAAPGRALVAKANAALRQLADTGLKATPQAEPEAEPAAEEERAPGPGEPLELPVNPY